MTNPRRPTPIAVTEQAGHRILILDPDLDWSGASAELWNWQPDAAREIGDPTTSWGLPNDVRLRVDTGTGRRWVLVSDSYGLLAQVPYPQGGSPAWSVEVGRDQNPHGIDLLPNGNIAAAASTGSWVRIFQAGQGRDCAEYVEAELADAHQVLWDDSLHVLWALGGRQLMKYDIGSGPTAPQITALASYDLPTNGGHDLQPVSNNPDHMWITTVYGVHQFSKSRGEFLKAFPHQRALYSVDIKSIGTDPVTGTVLETTPKNGNPSAWGTDQVDLFGEAGGTANKVLPGSQIYRARWFDVAAN